MTLPLGYRYAATHAGIRKEQKDDVALIVSDKPAQAAAVFTRNLVEAAPVTLARKHLKSSSGKFAALLVNAGNANCATRTGDRVARDSCKAVAKALKVKAEQVLPASTGVIGVELDPKLLTNAVPKLVGLLSPAYFEAVARAILTTDTKMKVASEQIELRAGVIRVSGMTKGSGMICPNMATTLGFVMTDAAVNARHLREMLVRAIDRSYHCLTVDGDTSTNDMVALIANGASNVTPNGKERQLLEEAVARVMESLVRQIASDGEGAKKLIVIDVSGFKTEEDARRIARAIANSLLVKTAISGSDPNWGRILAAAGYSGVSFDPTDVDIRLQGVLVCRRGGAAEFEEADLQHKLNDLEVQIEIIRRGWNKGSARFFTCDLTEGYVQINGSYRT